ncbi:hypothetical protein EDB80DRAFT_714919 [Ilyonectria destructans]|nr:hypothetical protein EDB80DRAFT_714919 [Ilyonectria destructans]
MSQRFPLPRAPICPTCHQASTRRVTNPANRNGNANRPFYFCDRSHKHSFITWDDARGIMPGNPQCWCGQVSRRDRASGPHLNEWYACASRDCGFRRELDENDPVELEHTPPPATARTYDASPAFDFQAAVSQYSSRSDLRSVSQPTPNIQRVVPDIYSLDQRMRAMSVTPTAHTVLQGSPPPSYYVVPGQAPKSPNPDCPLHGGRRKWFFGRVRCRCY